MKKLALAALIALAAPSAFAQTGVANSGFATQLNNQQGGGNFAANAGVIDQRGTAAGGLASTSPGAATSNARVAGTLDQLFGGQAIVDNNIAVGTQLNVQNGSGNVAVNEMSADQFAAASGGSGGGIANSNIGVGTQLNVQNGSGNVGVNNARLSQVGQSFGSSPFGSLVNNNIAVGTQVNVQNGDNNFAANSLGASQAAIAD